MTKRALVKFEKDFNPIPQWPNDLDETTISTSIQKVESTFSTFRRVENIDNLSKHHILAETMFRENKTLDFIKAKSDSQEIIDSATSSKNQNDTIQKNKEEDFTMKTKKYNRRLLRTAPAAPNKRRKEN